MKLKGRMDRIILASQSEVRKKILNDNDILCEVVPSELNEEPVKNNNKVTKN